MKKGKLLTVVALALILVLALAACGKKDGGGEAAAKYEGETAEKTLMDKLVVKYPAAFLIDETWTTDNILTLRQEGADWEVQVGYMEYGVTFENYEEITSFYNEAYGSKVEKTSLLGKEGFKVDAGAAYCIIVPLDDKNYVEFNCKETLDKEGDYMKAFKTPEVQYIVENLSLK